MSPLLWAAGAQAARLISSSLSSPTSDYLAKQSWPGTSYFHARSQRQALSQVCDPRQAPHPSRAPFLSLCPHFTRACVPRDLEHPPLGLGSQLTWHLRGRGTGPVILRNLWIGACEAEGKAHGRQTGVGGLAPPEPVWNHALSFVPVRACL